MIIRSSDNQRSVDVGLSSNLFALYSTIVVNLGSKEKEISMAVATLKNGNCDSKDCLLAARQFNLIRDYLSAVSPDKAVFDLTDLKKKGPWVDNLSPVVTSCANLFLTKDGDDLLFEIVSVLTYAYYSHTSVVFD